LRRWRWPRSGAQQSPGGTNGQPGERLVNGRVDKISDGELTLTTQFGAVKVKLASDAQFQQTEKADSSELKEGGQVIVNAETDSDGNMTSKSVLIK
jgi:hypothetical protein